MATTKITSPDLFNLESLDSALQLPSGTTAQRPSSATSGEWRFNTDTSKIEFYDGSAWYSLEPASGGGSGGFSTVNQSYAQWCIAQTAFPGIWWTEYADLSSAPNYTWWRYSGDIFDSGYLAYKVGYNGTCWLAFASNGTDGQVARSYTGVRWELLTTVSNMVLSGGVDLEWNGYSWAIGTTTTTGLFYNNNADGSGTWTSVSAAGARGNRLENYNNTQWLRNIDYDNLQVSTDMYPTSFTTFYNPSADDIVGIRALYGGTNFLTLYRGRPSASSNVGRELREWTSPTGSGTLVAVNANFGVGGGMLNTAAGTLVGWNNQTGDNFLTYDGTTATEVNETAYGLSSGEGGRVSGSYNGTSSAFVTYAQEYLVYKSGNDVVSTSGWTDVKLLSGSSTYNTWPTYLQDLKSAVQPERPFIITAAAAEETTTGTMDFLVQGGGGAGAATKMSGGYVRGSGGGAGAMLTSYGPVSGGGRLPFPPVTLGAGTYTITVGGGASSNTQYGGTTQAGNGAESSITGPNTGTYKTSSTYLTGDIAAAGGGGGATTGDGSGIFGGCAGGISTTSASFNASVNNYEVQNNGGFNGGAFGNSTTTPTGSGGGGVGMPGANAILATPTSWVAPGRGGDGISSYITGSQIAVGGGGGGGDDWLNYGRHAPLNIFTSAWGGGGQGGRGNYGQPGTANTGGGGGGGGSFGSTAQAVGGAGGSGVVILRMKTSDYSGTTTGSPTVTTDGNDTVLKYTGSGTYVHS